MGRTCGWHLAAGGGGGGVLLQLIPQESHAEPVYGEGSREGGGAGHVLPIMVFLSSRRRSLLCGTGAAGDFL